MLKSNKMMMDNTSKIINDNDFENYLIFQVIFVFVCKDLNSIVCMIPSWSPSLLSHIFSCTSGLICRVYLWGWLFHLFLHLLESEWHHFSSDLKDSSKYPSDFSSAVGLDGLDSSIPSSPSLFSRNF